MTRRREQGAALILALGALVLVATAAAAFDTRVVHLARENVAERARLADRAAVLGAIEFARATLAADAAWTGGTARVGDRDAAVRVAPDAAEPSNRVVHAACGAAHATVTLRVGDGSLPVVVAWRDG